MSILETLGLTESKSKKKGKYKPLPEGHKFKGGRRYENRKKDEPSFLETVVKQFTGRSDLYAGKNLAKGGMVTDYRKTGMTKSTVDNLKTKRKK